MKALTLWCRYSLDTVGGGLVAAPVAVETTQQKELGREGFFSCSQFQRDAVQHGRETWPRSRRLADHMCPHPGS